ncbi:beta-1,6-N-acetylglucosaminyltransferase [Parachlamydia sp. AcF125]|uniref:beta-1,6-N-acetylglucosaminyltransferase n=1 Tax=Parachlamydia sp. AcF125 TaxID=2795736 RepID=UPI001BCA55DC|nr:beta-1,6-N-acetylglucosaminyltransferase [Parachlamydia sp. AcF125]MBS4167522.1 hypothetical protein [Parachlamydia sp. AcF125]
MSQISLMRLDQTLWENVEQVAQGVQNKSCVLTTKLRLKKKDNFFLEVIKRILAGIGIQFERTYTPHVAAKLKAFVNKKKVELFEKERCQQNIANLTIIFQQTFKTNGVTPKKAQSNQKLLNECLELLPKTPPALKSRDLQERKEAAIAAALNRDEKIQAEGNPYVFNGTEIRDKRKQWGTLLKVGEKGIVQVLEDPNFVPTLRHFIGSIKGYFGGCFNQAKMESALGMIDTFIDEKQKEADQQMAAMHAAERRQQAQKEFAKEIEAKNYSLEDAYNQAVKWERLINLSDSDVMIRTIDRIEPLIARYLATVSFDQGQESAISLKNFIHLAIIFNSPELIAAIINKACSLPEKTRRLVFKHALIEATKRDQVFLLKKVDEKGGRDFLSKNLSQVWEAAFDSSSIQCIDYLLETKQLRYENEDKSGHVLELYTETVWDLRSPEEIQIAEKLKSSAAELINEPFKVRKIESILEEDISREIEAEHTALTYAVEKHNYHLFAHFLEYEGMNLLTHDQGYRALQIAIQEKRSVDMAYALLINDTEKVLWERAQELIPHLCLTDSSKEVEKKIEQACA